MRTENFPLISLGIKTLPQFPDRVGQVVLVDSTLHILRHTTFFVTPSHVQHPAPHDQALQERQNCCPLAPLSTFFLVTSRQRDFFVPVFRFFSYPHPSITRGQQQAREGEGPAQHSGACPIIRSVVLAVTRPRALTEFCHLLFRRVIRKPFRERP